MIGEQNNFSEKKKKSEELIFMYLKLLEFQESWLKKCFRFEHTQIFRNFQRKYSIPNLINFRLDDIIYLIMLLGLVITFSVLPSQSSHVLTKAFQHFNIMLWVGSSIWLIVNNNYKHLIFLLLLLIFPFLSLALYLNIFTTQNTQASSQIYSYLGYMSFWLVYVSLYITYPLKQFIRNEIGSLYSFLFAISFLTLFLIWPAYSLLEEFVANSTLSMSFIINNKALIMTFIVIITFSFHLFTHNTFFQDKTERVEYLLKQDFNQEELKLIRQGSLSDFPETIYENFTALTRLMSMIIFLQTLATQIFIFNYLSSNIVWILQCLGQMIFFISFSCYGCILNRLSLRKELVITVSCILTLLPLAFSPLYYSLSFNNYIFIAVALPYTNIFWCIVRSVSQKSPIFKMKVITVMFFLFHIPISIFILNSYQQFTRDSSIVSTLKITIGATIASISVILLVVVVAWLCLRLNNKSKSVKEDDNAVRTIDYNYFQEGNPPYPGYSTRKVFSLDWLTSIDFRNLGLIISSVLFVFCEMGTMYTFNELNNSLKDKVFQSTVIRQVIYQQFFTIAVFYITSQYYISASPNLTIEIILGISFLLLGLFGIIYSYMGSIIPLTFRIVGAFFLISLPVFYGFRVVKNLDINVAKFVAPLLIMTFWFVVIIPFVEVIPIVYVFISSESFGSFIYASILASTILIIVVVGGVSFIFNVLMNKFDNEKKIKFITQDVQSYLLDEGIQAPDQILHILYQSYDNRDKKYLYFLKRGYPVKVMQDQDNYELVSYDKTKEQQKKQQSEVQRDCCWSCLTFFCGKDDDQIQENIQKAVKKNNISDEELMNLLPQAYLKGFFGGNTVIVQQKYKKAVDPSKIYSSKSSILKNAHITRRHLGDDYALLQINHNVNIQIELWHKIYEFISNEDHREKQVIFTDLAMFLSLVKMNLSSIQLNALYSRFSTSDWGNIMALNIHDFSLLIEHLAQNLYPNSRKQERRIKFLLEKVYYNLAQYEEFQEQMMKSHNQVIEVSKIMQSPFINSRAKYEQNTIKNEKKDNKMIDRKKKHAQDKFIQPNEQVISRKKEEEEEDVKTISCKRLIYNKYLNLKKCCEKQNNQQEVIKRNRVKPWDYLAVESVRIMQQKENQWSEEHTTSEHRFRINFNNLMIASFKLLDIYTYLEISIRDPYVEWIQQTKSSNLLISYKYQLYICCAIIAISVPLGIRGILYILEDRLGLTEARTPANFPHRMYIFTSIYKLLILSLFTTVATTLLTTFNCTWTSTTYVLYDDSSITCFTPQHNIYIIISIIGLIIYYPLSAYTMPNFQFSEKILDLKFKPSYLVIYFQVNFVIAAGKVLLGYQGTNSTAEVVYISNNILMLVILGLAVIYLRPCLIQWFNYIEFLIILVGILVNSFGLLLYITKLWFLSVILVLVTSGAAIVITIIIIKTRYFGGKEVHEQSPQQLQELEQAWQYKNNKNVRLVKQTVVVSCQNI